MDLTLLQRSSVSTSGMDPGGDEGMEETAVCSLCAVSTPMLSTGRSNLTSLLSEPTKVEGRDEWEKEFRGEDCLISNEFMVVENSAVDPGEEPGVYVGLCLTETRGTQQCVS